MTAGVEAPVQAAALQLVGGQAAQLDGSIAEIDRWIVLDAQVWPFDRDLGSKPASDEAVPAPNSAPIRPRTRLAHSHGASPAICDVVAAWRAAERDLADLVENEPAWNRVRAEIIGLRALHHLLFEGRVGSRPGGGDATAPRSMPGPASSPVREHIGHIG
jgi:hypothetical protein